MQGKIQRIAGALPGGKKGRHGRTVVVVLIVVVVFLAAAAVGWLLGQRQSGLLKIEVSPAPAWVTVIEGPSESEPLYSKISTSGKVTIRRKQAGVFWINVRKDGFETYQTNVFYEPHKQLDVVVALQPNRGGLRIVLSNDYPQGRAEYHIQLNGPEKPALRRTFQSAVLFENLLPGFYSIEVWAPGFTTNQLDVSIAPYVTNTLPQPVVLKRLRGQLRIAGFKPEQQILSLSMLSSPVLEEAEFSKIYQRQTESIWVIPDLPTGEYRLALSDNFTVFSTNFSLSPAETVLDLGGAPPVGKPGSLQISVQTDTAFIPLWRATCSGINGTNTKNSQTESVRFSQLDAGDYRVSVDAEGFRTEPPVQTAHVSAGGLAVMEPFRLSRRKGTLELTGVLDANAQIALEGPVPFVESAEFFKRHSTLSEVSRLQLPTGKYRLEIRSTGFAPYEADVVVKEGRNFHAITTLISRPGGLRLEVASYQGRPVEYFCRLVCPDRTNFIPKSNTPELILGLLKPGKCQLQIWATGFETNLLEVEILPGVTNPVSPSAIALKRMTGRIRIPEAAQYPDLKVGIQRRVSDVEGDPPLPSEVSAAELERLEFPTGKYELEIKSERWEPVTQFAVLSNRGQEITLDVKDLKASRGWLVFAEDDKNAECLITDSTGRQIFTNRVPPDLSLSLNPGIYTVELQIVDCCSKPYSNVVISPRKTNFLPKTEWIRQEGILELVAGPPPVDYTVTNERQQQITNGNLGTMPLVLSLPVGQYTVEFSKPGFGTAKVLSRVRAGMKENIATNLQRETGWMTVQFEKPATGLVHYVGKQYGPVGSPDTKVESGVTNVLFTGPYQLIITSSPYAPRTQAFGVLPGLMTNLGLIKMDMPMGSLEVSYFPENAKIILKTPGGEERILHAEDDPPGKVIRLNSLPAGEYFLTATAQRYEKYLEKFEIKNNQIKKVRCILSRPRTQLSVTRGFQPEDIKLVLNGPIDFVEKEERLEDLPIILTELLEKPINLVEGTYSAVFSAPGHVSLETNFVIDGREMHLPSIKLMPIECELRLNSTPEKIPFELRLTKPESSRYKLTSYRGVTPAVFSNLPAGQYTVWFTNKVRRNWMALMGRANTEKELIDKFSLSLSNNLMTNFFMDYAHVRIETDPPGARLISVYGQLTTPVTLDHFSRSERVLLTLVKPGYKMTDITIKGDELRPQQTNTISVKLVFYPGPSRHDDRWTNSLGMIFVPIAASNTVKPSCLMSIWEVRVKDFEPFVREKNLSLASFAPTNAFGKDSSDFPVVNIPVKLASEYCEWLTARELGRFITNQSYRLPTSYEWDMAFVRGTGQESFENSAGIMDLDFRPAPAAANLDDTVTFDFYNGPAPVASFMPNQLGIYDLAGNVWEWCKTSDGDHVLRGYSYRSGAGLIGITKLRFSYADPLPAQSSRDDVGFRIVIDLNH